MYTKSADEFRSFVKENDNGVMVRTNFNIEKETSTE